MPSDEEIERLLRAYRPAEPRPGWVDSLFGAGDSPSLPWLDLACAAMLVLSVLACAASGRVQARLESLAGAHDRGDSKSEGSVLAGHVASIVEMAREVDR